MTAVSDPILDLIESTAADLSADPAVRDWILESMVPVLCAEIRELRGTKGAKTPDIVSTLIREAPAAVKPIEAKPPKTGKRGTSTPGIPGTHLPGLKAVMKRAGISDVQLSQKLGVSEAAVGNWKSGRTAATASRVPALAAALACKVEELTQ